MKPSGRIPRKTRLARGAKALRRTRVMKGRNAERRAKEWARAYGSEARVRWIQSLACVGCGCWGSENAHTVTDGLSRKADAETIAPLCRRCHTKYDQHKPPFDTELARDAVKLHAAVTDARWQRMGELTPLSAIVPGVVSGMLERSEEPA